ncbi:MAG: hypothetical protein H0W04_02800 [Chthoniobacterales bacterium]|nr:hypothetical protein [Chthoniobacterales bacterium]
MQRGRRSRIVAASLVLLVLTVGFLPSLDQAGLPMDEGSLLVYPELVLRGQIPYLDFETFYGPANLWVLSAAFSTFGANIFVERGVGLLYRVAVLLAIFGIAQRWGTILGAGVMFIAGVLLLPLKLSSYAWMGALACGLTALWLFCNESRMRCFLAGLLAGFALLFRPDLGPAVFLGAFPICYGMSWRSRYIFFAGVLPFGLLTLLAGPSQVLNNLFLFPVIHSNPARRLPLFSAGGSLVALLFLHLLACGVNLAAGFFAWRKDGSEGNGRLLTSTALFSAGLTCQATQRLDIIHFLSVGFLSISLLPVSLATLTNGCRAGQPARSISLLGISSVIAVVALTAPEITISMRKTFVAAFTSPQSAVFVNRQDRTFPFRSPQVAQAAGKMFETLGRLSQPGERLFVGPADLRRTNYCDTFIYHLFPDLSPATYFLEMNPLSANRTGSRLAPDVRSADWLVLNREWDAWEEPNRSIETGSDEPNAIVRTHFSLVDEFPPYLLLQRKY